MVLLVILGIIFICMAGFCMFTLVPNIMVEVKKQKMLLIGIALLVAGVILFAAPILMSSSNSRPRSALETDTSNTSYKTYTSKSSRNTEATIMPEENTADFSEKETISQTSISSDTTVSGNNEALEVDEDEIIAEQDESWRVTYRQYLYGVIAGDEYIPDRLEASYYDNGHDVFFALKDITDDDIPELWLSGIDDDSIWRVCTVNKEGKELSVLGELTFFQDEEKKGYFNSGTSFLGYEVYKLQDGKLIMDYTIVSGDSDDYYKGYPKEGDMGFDYVDISVDELEKFYNKFLEDDKKYHVEGIALNVENVIKILGGEKPDIYIAKSYQSQELEKMLDEQDLFENTSAREKGYDWMWIDESRADGKEYFVYYEPYVSEGEAENDFLSQLKIIDWDNDGENEYCFLGNMAGLYFDMIGDVLTAERFGPYGMGWSDYAYIDKEYWVYEASGHSGTVYEFFKFNGKHDILDRFCYEERYEYYEDGREEAYFKKGTDYDHMENITEDEFNLMCGENGMIDKKGPSVSMEGNLYMYGAIKAFFYGKIPVLYRYPL